MDSLRKRSQILCERVADSLLNMGWKSQTAVLEHFEDDEYYYLYILYFENLDFVFCQFGLCWISRFNLMNC